MPPIEVSERSVHALIERWFPDHAIAFERVDQGISTPVYRVSVDGHVTYLRLGEEPNERRDAEIRVHELLRARGLSVPDVVRWEREPPELDRSAALTSRIPGIPVGDYQGDATVAIRQAGRELAQINTVPVVGFGWASTVREDDHHLVAEHLNRAAWVDEYLAAVETVVAADIFPRRVHAVLRGAIQAWAMLPDQGVSHLAHGDFDATHIYVDSVRGAYQGLIDFGEIRGADPLYDLGHLLHNTVDARGRAVFEAAMHGYAEIAPVDLSLVRLQAIAIASRALAIQLDRSPNVARGGLRERLEKLLSMEG